MKQIKDPVSSVFVSIEDDELPLVDSSEFQRLRRVKQLGLSSLVYPGATHSRFIHSIGVLHLSELFCESLDITGYERKVIRCAGLLHDIGHGPFSHASEGAIENFPHHEEQSAKIIREFEERGILPVDAEDVIGFISGESNPSIIAGDIDADRIDYLRRDSHNTGVPHGTVDTRNLIESAILLPDGTVGFKRRGVESIEKLLSARKGMIRSVYQHPTARIAERMLEESISHITHDTVYGHPINRLDDSQMHTFLLNNTGIAGELYSNIVNRNLYKIAYEVRRRNFDGFPSYSSSQLETYLVEELSAEPHEVFVEYYNTEKRKPLDIDIKTKQGEILSFNEFSSVNQMLNGDGEQLMFAVYVKSQYQQKTNQILNRIDS